METFGVSKPIRLISQAKRGFTPSWGHHTVQYIHSPAPTEKEPVITPKTCQSGACGRGESFPQPPQQAYQMRCVIAFPHLTAGHHRQRLLFPRFKIHFLSPIVFSQQTGSAYAQFAGALSSCAHWRTALPLQ